MLSLVLAAVVSGGGLVVSAPDPQGRFTVEFTTGPIAIYRADGYVVWDYVLPMSAGTVCEVRSFIGWDRGSLGEANMEANVSGYRVYERSEHKEKEENYDAWRMRRTMGPTTGLGALLHLHLGATQTGANTHDGGLSTRVEFAVRVGMVKGEVCQ